MSKRAIGILVTIVVLMLVFAFGTSARNNRPEKRLQNALELGQKYLTELNYEQAIACFEEAMEIEPMNTVAVSGITDAYVGWGTSLSDNGEYESAIQRLETGMQNLSEQTAIIEQMITTYLAWAEDYAGKEDYDNAIRTLQEGYKKTNDKRLNGRAEKYIKIAADKEEEQVAKRKTAEVLTSIAMYCSQGDYKTAWSVLDANTTSFSDVKLPVSLDEPYIVDTEFGKIGSYYSEIINGIKSFMVYFGEYIENVRQGNGVWIAILRGTNLPDYYYYCSVGAWENDKPNGYQTVVCDTPDGERTLEGNVNDGYWDGDVMWSFNSKQFLFRFEKGEQLIQRYDYKSHPSHPYQISFNENELWAKAPGYHEGIIGFTRE